MASRVVFFSVIASISAVFAAETVTVDNVVSLTNELDRLNRLSSAAGKSQGTIILKKGMYDVSDCHMLCDSADTKYLMSTSHLAVAYVTLKGETDDPRDVVLYGDRSDRIMYMFMGKIHNLTISNGCRTVGDVGGGGVCARNQGSSLSNVVVTCCHANKKGGGVYYAYMYDSVIENCSSDSTGGGIYLCYGYFGGRITGNRSAVGGGGACSTSLVGVRIEGNTTDGKGGGVIYDYGSYGTTNCTIVGNTATEGGGVSGASMVYDCVISNNVAVQGGGIANSTVYRCDIVHNTARAVSKSDAVKGGGCYGGEAGNCKVYDSIVAGNACALELAENDRSGGAGDQVWFYNCTIRDNFARIGASLNWGKAEDCIISNNVSPLFYHNLRGTKSLTRCVVSDASLTSPGALADCVIKDYDGTWELSEGANVYTNGTFVNTNATSDTYRLFANNIGSVFSLTNCLIYGNKAYSILKNDKVGEPVNVVNCTIVDNTNTCMFAGFKTNENVTALYLKNTIICRNRQMSNPANDWNMHPQYSSPAEANLYIENCMIGPGGVGVAQARSCTGLISSNDPKFQEHRNANHPYALRRTSGAIGKGTVEDWMLGAYDIRHTEDDGKYLRLRDGKVDFGCYQCWLDPVGTVFNIR